MNYPALKVGLPTSPPKLASRIYEGEFSETILFKDHLERYGIKRILTIDLTEA
ncbi:MAG TPA: hypothetical protein PLQ01_01610 [Methanothrix sp.]|nr:hypothetical protein [Methanothrix sp.]